MYFFTLLQCTVASWEKSISMRIESVRSSKETGWCASCTSGYFIKRILIHICSYTWEKLHGTKITFRYWTGSELIIAWHLGFVSLEEKAPYLKDTESGRQAVWWGALQPGFPWTPFYYTIDFFSIVSLRQNLNHSSIPFVHLVSYFKTWKCLT